MAWSEEEYQEYEARCAAASWKWGKDKKRQEEVMDAFRGWSDLLEKILVQRTRHDLDHFSEYPYAEDFILGCTPEQAANQMIESMHIPTLYVVG